MTKHWCRYMQQTARNSFSNTYVSNVFWINYIDGTPGNIGLLGYLVSAFQLLVSLKYCTLRMSGSTVLLKCNIPLLYCEESHPMAMMYKGVCLIP